MSLMSVACGPGGLVWPAPAGPSRRVQHTRELCACVPHGRPLGSTVGAGLAALLVLPCPPPIGRPRPRAATWSSRRGSPRPPTPSGWATRLPRAVPLDAVVALLTSVVDGGVLFRRGRGRRAAAGRPAARTGWSADLSLAARWWRAWLAVWNPFVVERLALGQWALLAGVRRAVVAAPGVRAALDGAPARLAAVVRWVVARLAHADGGRPGCRSRPPSSRRWPGAAPGSRPGRRRASLLQLPWVLPGAARAGRQRDSDPTGVDRLRRAGRTPRGSRCQPARARRHLGLPAACRPAPGSVLGLVVVRSCVVVLVGRGSARLWRRDGRWSWRSALLGFLLAGRPACPGGATLLRGTVTRRARARACCGTPRSGWRRSSSWPRSPRGRARRLPPVGCRRAGGLARRVGLGAGVALRPAPRRHRRRPGRRSGPVDLPGRLREAVDADRPPDEGAMLLLPRRSYRRFDWGNPRRRTTRPSRGSRRRGRRDELGASGGAGQRARTTRSRGSARCWRRPDPAAGLADLGIGWVLVYTRRPGHRGWPSTGSSGSWTGPTSRCTGCRGR